ncbi:hypothetical protein ACU4HD_27365 [Cupriavidus basilensis]
MMFQDGTEAATRLAEALSKYRGTHPVVLAIPRGASTDGQDRGRPARRRPRCGAGQEAGRAVPA